MNQFIRGLQQQLAHSLPGKDAQYLMAPMGRPREYSLPSKAKEAAVLILFFLKDEEPHFTLIERAYHPKDAHSKQISLPGGKYEETDLDFSQTAIRETEEEIGIPQDDIQLLGHLSDLYIPVSNFMVYPYVGYLSVAPRFIPEPSEVGQILEVSIKELLDTNNWNKKDLLVRNQMLKDIPIINLQNKVVWGATSMILSELKAVVERVEF